jgi:hypothetical protein
MQFNPAKSAAHPQPTDHRTKMTFHTLLALALTLAPSKRYATETPLNNLWLSMLERVDVRVPFVGDSTGSLKGL